MHLEQHKSNYKSASKKKRSRSPPNENKGESFQGSEKMKREITMLQQSKDLSDSVIN